MRRGIIKVVIVITLTTFILSLFGVQSILDENEQLKIENTELQTKLNLSQAQITTLNSEIAVMLAAKNENKCYPRNWESLDELKEFLSENKINTEAYVNTTHDCDDFSQELQQAALRWKDGLFLGACVITNSRGELHMKNMAIVGNNIYLVEPQSDVVTLYCTVD